MLNEGSTTNSERFSKCQDCDAHLIRGARGPARLRCLTCIKKIRKRVRQVKSGVVVALGQNTLCGCCGGKITRTGGNKKFCEVCALSLRRKRDRERYFLRQDRVPIPGIGSKGTCQACSSEFVKTRSDHAFCQRCSDDRRNEYVRRARDEERRLAGAPVRSGVSINCSHCGVEFTRNSHNGKYCKECYNQPRIRYTRRRKRIDPAFALNHVMGAAIRKSLNRRKAGYHWEELVGYTLSDLMRHLELRFADGMSWENRSDWHVDHIRPLASFKFIHFKDADFRTAWALSNLQPLWAADNIRKSAKMDWSAAE